MAGYLRIDRSPSRKWLLGAALDRKKCKEDRVPGMKRKFRQGNRVIMSLTVFALLLVEFDVLRASVYPSVRSLGNVRVPSS